MVFKQFDLNSADELLPYLEKCPYLGSDFTLGYLLMWYKELNVQYCITKDTFIIRYDLDDLASFTFPFGPHTHEVLIDLIEFIKNNNLPLRFYGIDEETIRFIENDEMFHDINLSYDIRWSDYIYSFKDVLTFSGKKYRGQRNHINKYKSLYGEPKIKELSLDILDKVFDMLNKYELEHQDYNALEKEEYLRTIELIKNYDKFHQIGIVFLNDKDEVIGVSVGEILHDTLIIHVEKALKDYDGVYPTLYQSFVRWVNDNIGELTYINREDDSGDEGLRISKTQYQPIDRIHKYVAQVNSPIHQVSWDVIRGENIVLTRFQSKDAKAYHELNIDQENNKYWGYDYTEDLSITTLNENTFYDMAVGDMMLGQSINFAIRETVDGPMIGETILWNFTFNGDAELGCRVSRQYQHHSYGKQAFYLTYKYATEELKLKIWARCYKENVSSRKMIEDAGLKLVEEDDTFLYFR